MKKYVLGFMFSEEDNGESVSVIRKQKPEWQKGRLNGIGGKIEEGESNIDAMIREFLEETGVAQHHWKEVGELHGKDWVVYVFSCFGNLRRLKTVEEEEVLIIDSKNVYRDDIIENLQWIIPMCKHHITTEEVRFNIKYPIHE